MEPYQVHDIAPTKYLEVARNYSTLLSQRGVNRLLSVVLLKGGRRRRGEEHEDGEWDELVERLAAVHKRHKCTT